MENTVGIESEVFESRLASGFQSLLTPTGGSYMSLPWIQQSLAFLNQMQTEMDALAPNLHNLPCEDTSARSKWLREGVEDMDKVLQVCAILVRSVSDVRYYHMFVQLVIQSVQSNKIPRARQVLSSRESVMAFPDTETSRLSLQRARLEKGHRILLQLLLTEIPPFPAEDPSGRDVNKILLPMLYGLRSASIFVLLVLGACLTVRPRRGAIKKESDVVRSALGGPEDVKRAGARWVEPMMKLCESVSQEVLARTADCSDSNRPFAFLHELGAMDELVRELGNLMDESNPDQGSVQLCLSELRRSVDGIESALPAVESHIHGISRTIASSRAIVLELLHHWR